MIDTAITNKSVAIILDPADASGSIGAVKRAIAANIPVFLVNAEINQEGLAKAQLVSNNAQGATIGAQAWAEAVGGKGKYVELFGNPTDNNAQVRSDGYTVAPLVCCGTSTGDFGRAPSIRSTPGCCRRPPTIPVRRRLTIRLRH